MDFNPVDRHFPCRVCSSRTARVGKRLRDLWRKNALRHVKEAVSFRFPDSSIMAGASNRILFHNQLVYLKKRVLLDRALPFYVLTCPGAHGK